VKNFILICDKYGIPIDLDEAITGFGRNVARAFGV
jgi:adenosylmethionine-8-amino-7-oxononanoate aminotransferase